MVGGTENPLGVQHYPQQYPPKWGVLGLLMSEISKKEEYPREWGVLIHALGVVLKMRYSKHINDANYSEKLKETMQNVTIFIKNMSSRRRQEKFLSFSLRI